MTPPSGSEIATTCLVCGALVVRTDYGSSSPSYPCRACGPYRLTEYAAQRFHEAVGMAYGTPTLLQNHHLLSAVLRERHELTGAEVPVASLDELRAAARPLPDGYLGGVDRVLVYAADHLPRLGGKATLVPQFDYPLAYARDPAELVGIVELGVEMKYLHMYRKGNQADDPVEVSPTVDGWRRLQEIRTRRVERRQAFVAMAFADDLAPAYADGIAPALEATGYRPYRVDRVEHNDKIDDRIVAGIRQSGLLVADFTLHRGGVYFEAGLALGLGLPVIWTCRRDDIGNAHFDTRQYNHIVWDAPADLLAKLRARIEATLPAFAPAAFGPAA